MVLFQLRECHTIPMDWLRQLTELDADHRMCAGVMNVLKCPRSQKSVSDAWVKLRDVIRLGNVFVREMKIVMGWSYRWTLLLLVNLVPPISISLNLDYQLPLVFLVIAFGSCISWPGSFHTFEYFRRRELSALLTSVHKSDLLTIQGLLRESW